MNKLPGLVLATISTFLASWAAASGEWDGFADYTGQDSPPAPAGTASWAKPLAGRPLRTLLVAPRHTLRDALELAWRLDVAYDIVSVWSTNRLGYDPLMFVGTAPGAAESEVTDRLRRAFEDEHDLIVFANMDLAAIPEALAVSLKERVAHGTGLLLAQCAGDAPPALDAVLETSQTAPANAATRGIGAAVIPEWDGGLEFVQALEFKEGRVVILDYPGPRPMTHCLIPCPAENLYAEHGLLDTYLALVTRAALWAAGRRPEARIERIEDLGPQGPPESEIPPELPPAYIEHMRDAPGLLPTRPCRVHFGEGVGRRFSAAIQAREPGRNVTVALPEVVPLSKGASFCDVHVPIGSGPWLMDVWLLDGRGDVVDWHTERLVVHAWPELEHVGFSKSYLFPNDVLDVSIEIRPTLQESRAATVYVRAVDLWGRNVAETYGSAPATGGRVNVRLTFADLLANRLKIEVYALGLERRRFTPWDLGRAAYDYAYLPVRAPWRDEGFGFVVHGLGASDYNARHFNKVLAGLGADAIRMPAGASPHYPAEADLRPLASIEPRGLSRTDGEANTLDSGHINDAPNRLSAHETAKFGPLAYMLDQNVALEHLSKNRETVESPIRALRAALRDMDPSARLGLSLAQTDFISNGSPSARLLTEFEFVSAPYETNSIENLRSSLRSDAYAVLRLQPAKHLTSPQTANWFPWYAAFHGFSGIELTDCYGDATTGAPGVALSPDGSPSPCLLQISQQIKELKAGLGTLLRLSESATSQHVNIEAPADIDYITRRFGDAELVAFLRKADAEKKTGRARMRFHKKYVYDLRLGRRVERRKRVSARLARGGAALYAVLPYETTRVAALVPDAVQAGRRLRIHIIVKARETQPGTHVAHIEFAPQNGAALPHYSKDVTCPVGEGHTFIPLALNERGGAYKLTVRDVLTGISDEKTITVVPGSGA